MAINSFLTHLTDFAKNQRQTQSEKPHLSSVSYLTRTNTMSTTSSQDSSSSHSDSTTIEPVVSTPRRLYTRAGRAAAAVISTITTPFTQAERQNRLQEEQIQALYAADNYPSSSSDENSIGSDAQSSNQEDAEASDNKKRRRRGA